MGIYLVERYLPDIGHDGLRALAERLETASAQLRATGVPVRYLGSLFLPDEESCFCRLEAPSADAAISLNELAAAPYARISAAMALGAPGDLREDRPVPSRGA
jgi:Protein of unknown function (DUF4242)